MDGVVCQAVVKRVIAFGRDRIGDVVRNRGFRPYRAISEFDTFHTTTAIPGFDRDGPASSAINRESQGAAPLGAYRYIAR